MIPHSSVLDISNGESLIIHQLADESMTYELRNSSEVSEEISEEHFLKILLQEEEETIIKLVPLSNKLTDLRIMRHRIFDSHSIHFNS